MSADEDGPTCGQELAAAAEVPLKWQALMDHVAGNMETHAAWVGSAPGAARREHEAMLRVAAAYRAMAAAAGQEMRDLPPAPHDPARLDRPALARWMRAKIAMQRDLAAVLVRHAEESEAALAEAGSG
jgi:hypothetical protein